MPAPVRLVTLAMVAAWSTGCCQVATAKTVRTVADFNAIGSAIKTYRLNTGELPSPEMGLQALIERPASLPPSRRWVQVLNRLPLDPWNRPYCYLAGDSFEAGFGLYTCGPDGVSASIGNDPDDQNSWNEESIELRKGSWNPRIAWGAVVLALASFFLGLRKGAKKHRESPVI